ncbi:MAG: prepilin-type N-terminal cleavage/methylation domain-containing protein, partial [Planctomycetia bacterium]|nr:prepilin-type N-terminal cleavage/methylation domain-containing protein [Planctomycetia bacterium]
MNRKTGLFSYFSRPRVGKDRSGYTLLEILVAVSLMLMLMYAVAAIFGRVGTIMNQTQGAMTLASGLRDTSRRLEADLKQVSVPLIPPRNSRNNEGYFCIVEGLGGSFQKILNTTGEINGGTNFAGTDIAWDMERSGSASIAVTADGFTANGTVVSDTTTGDTDDILMFTAKAPAGQFFRGRFLSPVYDNSNRISDVSYDIIESEYAEIIWFLRGTTLYRRVLLIIPQEKLEEGLKAADWLAWKDGYSIVPQEVKPGASGSSNLTPTWTPASGSYSKTPISPVRLGYGFFNFFDVSVHIERFDNPTALKFSDGTRPDDATGTYKYFNAAGKQCSELERVVANTLGDLSNRKNRYGYWNSVCGTAADNANYVDDANMQGLGKLHGNFGAWYWLRLPTLQESASFRPSTRAWNNIAGYLHSFRAGVPFGGMLDASYWRGVNQALEAAYSPVTSLTTATTSYLGGNALPLTPTF